MCVLYAFMRHTDDVSDQEDLPLADRRERLLQWRLELAAALAGQVTSSPILPALTDVVQRQQIPHEYLKEVLNGVEGDLTPRTFQTFAELEQYCYQVAGVVGLCCLKIWGYHGPEPREPAIACGTAFQLTNILRDLKEDAQRGRLYLPQSELQTFGYTLNDLHSGHSGQAFQELMNFQVDRARSFYSQALPLQEQLSPPGRRIFLTFFDLYESLLSEIERANFDVLSQRIQLSRWKKIRVMLHCALRRG